MAKNVKNCPNNFIITDVTQTVDPTDHMFYKFPTFRGTISYESEAPIMNENDFADWFKALFYINSDIAYKPVKVIFNDPCTIAFWPTNNGDLIKTVARCCEDDEFDPEVGLMVCYIKYYYLGPDSKWKKDIKNFIADDENWHCPRPGEDED